MRTVVRALTIALLAALVWPLASRGASPVLYESSLGCPSCFWELVLTGHPTDPDQLALAGVFGGLRLSRDGGRTWSPGAFLDVPIYSDPKALVTGDGTLLLSALASLTNPADDGSVRSGVLYQAPLSDASFPGTLYKEPPADLPAGVRSIVDFPKLAYAPGTGAIYIGANAVRFLDGTLGPGLFVSRDGGLTFTEQKLDYGSPGQTRRSPPLSMDVTPQGALRIVVTAGADQQDRQYLLRFDVDATSFDVIPGPPLSNFYAPIALKARGGTTGWLVYQGPEIAIDETGPHAGRIYATWAQPQSIVFDPAVDLGRYGRDFDVFLAFSDDDGVTWSTPVKVNEDGTTGDQFFPSIRVDAAGIAHVVFLDRRENPDLPQFDVYYALVAGGRVSRNVRVNGLHVTIADTYAGREVGDYLDMVVAHPTRSYVAYPCLSAAYGPTDACVAAVDPTQFPPSGDLLKCYRAPATAGFVPHVVTLDDRFEHKIARVVAPATLCNAVERDDNPVLYPSGHLRCYGITDTPPQAHFARRDVPVDDAFGRVTWTLTASETLCLRAATDFQEPPPNLDHFKCYRARPKAGMRGFVRRSLALTDAFEGKTALVLKPEALCVAVDVDGAGFRNPAATLSCYRIKNASGQGRSARRAVQIDDDLGVETATVSRPRLLCVPASD